MKEFFDDLVHRIGKVFGMLPNGDSGKIHKAAETWRIFADTPIILEAADRITAISDLFIAMDADNHRNEIQGHLNDLRTSAQTVSLAANRMAPPVDDYYEALIAVSTACTDRINLSESGVGVTATARHGVSGLLFDVGLPASAAARGNKVSVDGTMDAIQSAYQASALPTILGMRALDVDAKGAVAAFNDVPATGLDSAIDRLSVIIAMKATLDENSGPGSTSSAPGSIDESAKKFNDREKRIAVLQASEGHHVRAVPESNVPGMRTADAEVDGVPTEYKSLDPGATNGTVKNQLNSAQGQADHAVLDARGSGLSEEEARRGMNRYLGANDGKMTDIRIIGDGWEIRWP
ncbi:hypothetical protein ACFYU5_23560 [Nocardia aobensis]|uniref:tRNA nuclease CdiA C-terminal domain-containing protein n=1 Tax=Nocardia aobensis TaxID=257277 RepID=A0ABW6P8D1_9NOCA